jgi:hypothetical protein
MGALASGGFSRATASLIGVPRIVKIERFPYLASPYLRKPQA